MPFILYHNKETACTEPRFQCDFCHHIITEADSAILAWRSNDFDDTSFVIACKGGCSIRSAKTHRFSMQLDTAIIYLLNNCGMIEPKLNLARRNAALLDTLS